MTPSEDYVLSKGSTILVTGANGFVASNIIEQLLSLGYKVRGTTRSLSKLEKLQQRWNGLFPGMFEGVVVEDITREGAYDNVLADVEGFMHVASPINFSTDYSQVVNAAVEGALVALRATQRHESIKRFVLTSSMCAVADMTSRKGRNNDEKRDKLYGGRECWNDESIEMAKSLPDEEGVQMEKGFAVYCASKVEAERAAWKFVEENKPSFGFNTVLPGYSLGTILGDASQTGSSASMLNDFFLSKADHLPSAFVLAEFVHIKDVALLESGALLLPSINMSRLIATPHACGWNGILSIFRSNFPQRAFRDDVEGESNEGGSRFEVENSKEVLRMMGREDWIGIEEAVLENVAAVVDP